MVNLIKTFEGYRKKAYKCPAGVWTIGYGTTRIKGQPVQEGMTASIEQAEEYLKADLKVYEHEVNVLPNIDRLSQQQFDALISFCYNVGNGSFHRSTLRRLIIANPQNAAISKEFCKWCKAGGVKLKGLEKRRAIEAAWYFYGADYSNTIKDVILWANS